MRRTSLSTAALLWLAAGATSTLQQPHDLSPMPFRAAVEAVTIDVGVIDEDGKPVEDLGARDFIVTVAGQSRRVVSATFVGPDAKRSRRAAVEPAGDIAVPVSTNDNVGVGRLVLFAVDQNTLDLTQARQVTDSAARLFDHLTPADRSALVVMPVGAGVPFTSDHDHVMKALQRSAGLATTGSESRALGLDEARAIANGDFAALRTVAGRECPSERGADPTQGLPSYQSGGGQSGSGGGTRGQQTNTPTSDRGFESTDSCTRQLQFEATSVWHQAHGTSIASMTSLRGVLGELKKVPGEKTLVLISGGWPLDVRETTSELAPLASAAADARVTVFTLFAANPDNSADRRTVSAAPLADMAVRRWPLQTLAEMTGGGSYRVDAGAGAVFDRLGRELSGFYRVSVEQDPRDFDGPARLLKVHVLRKGATARAPERFLATSYSDRDLPARLEAALISPLPATGLGMRIASYVAAEPGANDRAKIVLVCEVFGMQPGEVTFQLALRDAQGKVVETAAQKVGSAVADQLPFTTSINVAPGRYAVRAAAMDAAGSVGSVDHVVEVTRTVVGDISTGDLTLGRVPAREGEPAGFLLDAIAQEDQLALQIDLTGDPDRVSAADVLFELAASDDGPTLASVEATRSSGSGQGLAQAVADIQLLPPGVYVARAKVSDGTGASAIVRRPFIVTSLAPRPGTGGSAAGGGLVASAASGPRVIVRPPPFALEQVLSPAVLGTFVDRLAARPDAAGPSVAPVLDRLRTAPARDLVVPAQLTAESPVAAGFATGIWRLARSELDPAAQAFRASLRASSDFYPAMIYLGACFAAAGKDLEAAGAWQTALIKEGDVPALHQLLVDALLRLKRTDAALAAIERARRRWPDDPAFTRRYVLATFSAGRYADGLSALDRITAPVAGDEPVLVLGIQALYQAIAQGRPIESPEADKARLLRYAEAYRALNGPSMALVETWVAAALRER
jgi:VWFA-related protein